MEREREKKVIGNQKGKNRERERERERKAYLYRWLGYPATAIVGLALVVASRAVLGSLAVVGWQRGSTSLACFKWHSYGSPAIWFGGSRAMRVYTRISNNGRSSTAITREFLAGHVSA
jgi:hypothetical protein